MAAFLQSISTRAAHTEVWEYNCKESKKMQPSRKNATIKMKCNYQEEMQPSRKNATMKNWKMKRKAVSK